MKTSTCSYIKMTATAAALLVAFGPVQAAEDDDIAQLTKPESSIEAGIGYVNKDNQRFGQYNGLKNDGVYGLLDVNVVQRDDATGTWLKFSGRNLGLDNRELRFEHNRQGNWGYFVEYGQTPRENPLTVSTRLGGAGATTQTINAAVTPYSLEMKTQRDALTLGFEKLFIGGFSVQVRFKNEEKDGARMYGQGTSNTVNFLTDPIDQITRQLDVTLAYAGERLQLSGGYYGTSFENKNKLLNIVGGIAGQTPMALPPDNQSHQLHLSGGYSFTSTTRGTFKAAYTHQTQDDTFIVLPTLSGRTNLGGVIDTKLLQAGITSRPLPKLSLLANIRYEDRPDKTPVALYNTVLPAPPNPPSTQNGNNEPRSIRSLTGKAEASYSLPMGFRITGGFDYDQRNRNVSPVRVVSAREETEEKSWRAELRRSMSDTVTGALSYVHSDRDGSPFLTTTRNDGSFGPNLIAPSHLADRKRDKVRLSVNWEATDQLSLQFFADQAKDKYEPRTALGMGPSTGKAQNYAIDATYTVSTALQATAWYSRNDTRSDQATCAVNVNVTTGAMTCPTSQAANLRNVGDSFGVGLRGKPMERLELGADFSYSDINDEYRQRALAGAAIASLPDVSTKLTSLKAFAKYAIQKNAGVRLNYVYDRVNTNDWTWTNFTYLDGTRVFQNPNQKVHFIGVSYYYRWQ